ncbi:unnamed protein product, partial [marine sediment metagenome]
MGKKLRTILENHEPRVQRALEVLPGAIAWSVILFPIWGALVIPRIVAYFTVGFLVYWFYHSCAAAFFGIKGYRKIRQSEVTNWQQKYRKDKDKSSLEWEQIRHLIIIPNVNESIEKLSQTLNCLVNQEGINTDQLIVVLAMEARVAGAQLKAEKLIVKFEGRFGKLLATFHPDGLPGEIVGKASNEAWAAKKAKKLLVDKEGLDIKKITITSCDADSCFHARYFAALTYYFTINKNR